ncbi:TonB-dependent receptor [Salinimicrobium sp. GXAS 041]|uniref:TonB-dependent receptor n=1 Tax=Salinimicrobium sp. GXAS 041 TaxID=3400806 RepID=UPI003C75B18D
MNNLKTKGILLLFTFFTMLLQAQEPAVTGIVINAATNAPIENVTVSLQGEILSVTSSNGEFTLFHPLPVGEQVINFEKPGYIGQRFTVVIEEVAVKELGVVLLRPDLLQDQQQASFISLADDELDEEEGGFDNVSGLLQATRDVFLNAAAYDFSASFFRPRGFDSEHGKVLINGIEMNKLYNGRPQWSNWGGLNDVQRNQVFSMGLSPSEVSFGGLAGTTNIIMRASEYTKGGKVSYATSNRTYSGRVMGSYSSGLNLHGWAYTFSVSRRFAEESFREGTTYESNGIFASVEKKINGSHSLNFSGIYTPLRRGKTSPATSEVYNLKGIRYNSYWGNQDGEIRNSRMSKVEEPVLMLNHFWQLNRNSKLNTNVGYQFGRIGNSRLDYGGSTVYSEDGLDIFLGGGSNPDPAYYQKLPSYFLRIPVEPDYREAYLAQQEFQQDGQIDWASMYSANLLNTAAGGNAVYMLYEDRNDDKIFSANTIFESQVDPNILLHASVGYRNMESENFAAILDLLGGNAFLDVDSFSEGAQAQSDLRQPNRLAVEGDKIKYHFRFLAEVFDAFTQAQFNYKKYVFFMALKGSQTQYLREGFFQNGNFPDNSLGKSSILSFTDYGAKSGLLYKITGRHLLGINGGYYTKAPNLRNSFSNSRQNNDVVTGLQSEKIAAADASYIYRSPIVKTRLTGYFAQVTDATEISFYYADGISGLGRNTTTAFVQEVLNGIEKRHFGMEFGLEAQVTSTIKLKGAAGLGEYFYSNNPKLYLTSDDFDEVLDMGTSHLKNYKIAGGPQRAYQLGFEYRDPEFWFVSASANHFSNAFLDVAPLTRTYNFSTDADGLPLLNYDETIARELLKQEQFDPYFLLNMTGGKTWRVSKYYVGVFASVNNLLNTIYKTGGYEQSRNANYTTMKADFERHQPIFGPKYWYGYGTTYYSHVYVRF